MLPDLGKLGGPYSSVFDNRAIESGAVFPQHMFQEIPFSVLWGINTWADVSCKGSMLRVFSLFQSDVNSHTQERFCVLRGLAVPGSSTSILSVGGKHFSFTNVFTVYVPKRPTCATFFPNGWSLRARGGVRAGHIMDWWHGRDHQSLPLVFADKSYYSLQDGRYFVWTFRGIKCFFFSRFLWNLCDLSDNGRSWVNTDKERRSMEICFCSDPGWMTELMPCSRTPLPIKLNQAVSVSGCNLIHSRRHIVSSALILLADICHTTALFALKQKCERSCSCTFSFLICSLEQHWLTRKWNQSSVSFGPFLSFRQWLNFPVACTKPVPTGASLQMPLEAC